jgi:NAD(P)-dependent dehydrogenase (short-subunit alcohol dehydrogenase family)
MATDQAGTLGKVVVFGGGSGAGLAAARLLSQKGAEVIVAGRGVERLAQVEKETGGRIATRSVDGKDPAALEAFFAEVGPYDHLVITAGQTDPSGRFVDEMTLEGFRATFDGKFWVQVATAQAGARRIRPGGSITFFSGGANRRAMKGFVNIAAGNAAIDALVPVLALELAPTRVNAISPGTLATSYWTGVPEERLGQIFARMASALPAGRVGTPEDIAQAVLFLLTTSFVTGTVLAVDGGLPHSSV